ncbi:MAG TPA: hypothetical protein VLM85_09610 [Polyangiaceae bacterium]|nr:hypothetical protein [Polyangiaceae bacterium]
MNHRSLAFALALGALAACDASSHETVACAESLSAYCDAAPCVLQIDRNDVGGSFCASQPAPFVTFGLWDCDDGGATVVQSSLGTFQYGADGSLEAVTHMQLGAEPLFSCIAGPARFEPPATCLSWFVGYECVRVDGGTD